MDKLIIYQRQEQITHAGKLQDLGLAWVGYALQYNAYACMRHKLELEPERCCKPHFTFHLGPVSLRVICEHCRQTVCL